MTVRIYAHAHAEKRPCTVGCIIEDVKNGSVRDFYWPDRAEPPGHECRRRMLSFQVVSSTGATPGPLTISLLPGLRPVTVLLMYCDGCGTYTTDTVRERWDLPDLDPAFPAGLGPDGPPAA